MSKTVLLQQRLVASGTASGLPITITAATQRNVEADVPGLLANIKSNEVIRVRIQDVTVVVNSPLVVILQAAMYLVGNGISIGAPAFAGTYNGTLDGAKFQGEVEFQSNDYPGLLAAGALAEGKFIVNASNPDSADHEVTSFSVTFEVKRTQWSEPSYGSPIE